MIQKKFVGKCESDADLNNKRVLEAVQVWHGSKDIQIAKNSIVIVHRARLYENHGDENGFQYTVYP